MMIRRYVGADEKALLKRIRVELGPDAVILHTVYGKRKGLFGLFRHPQIEIVAGGGFRIVKDYANGRPSDPAGSAGPAQGKAPAPESLRKELGEIKKLLVETQESVRRRNGFDGPQELTEEYAALAAGRVSEALAGRMVRELRSKLPEGSLRDRTRIRAALRGLVSDMIRCGDGIALQAGRCVKVAFIGPTGVGKTTTIAKLISIYAHQGREVAVITNDTYRIAATEQIRRVAQLVGVPIRICPRPEEIEAALAEFSNRDLVLVDTAGRSQKNARRIDELKGLLAAVRPDETHLVVSMTTQPETVVDVAERFAPCAYDRLVVTKLDEAVKMGVVLDVLSRVHTQLSFITTGQEIPRDIEVADPHRITSLILGEEAL
jgi:flagellar biosynthesis protein FlhF